MWIGCEQQFAPQRGDPVDSTRGPLSALAGLVVAIASVCPVQAQVGSLPPELRQEWEKRQRERFNPPLKFVPVPPLVPPQPEFVWPLLIRQSPRTRPPVLLIPDDSPLAARKPKHLRMIGAPFPGPIASAVFRPDDKGLALMTTSQVYGKEPNIYYWDPGTRVATKAPDGSVPHFLLHALDSKDVPQGRVNGTSILSIDVTSTSHDGTLTVRWTRGGSQLRLVGKDQKEFRSWEVGKDHGAQALVFSPDDRLIASVSYPTTKPHSKEGNSAKVVVWETMTGRSIAEWTVPIDHRGYPVPAFKPDGTELALGRRGIIEFRDVKTGQKTGSISDRDLRPTGIAPATVLDPDTSVRNFHYSPDGRRLVIHSREGFQVWDLQSRTKTASHDSIEGPVVSLAFDPAGSRVVCTSGETVSEYFESGTRLLRVVDERTTEWDASTGLLAGSAPTRDTNYHRPRAVAFSPDGRWIARGESDVVRLWEAESQRLAATFEGHSGEVLSLAFSPDSTTLASGGADGTVQLWSVADAVRPSSGVADTQETSTDQPSSLPHWLLGAVFCTVVVSIGVAWRWRRNANRAGGTPSGPTG